MPRALGELEQTLLYALVALGPETSGLDLRREVRRRCGRDLAPGAAYTALGRLEERGLVSSALAEGSELRGRRPQREYTVLPAGAAELAKAYDHIESMARGLRSSWMALAADGRDK